LAVEVYATPTPTPPPGRSVNFDTPILGNNSQQIFTSFVDAATGVIFTVEPTEQGGSGSRLGGVVGLVKNNQTPVCVKPADENQKLGTATQGSDNIGSGGLAIRATFPEPVSPPLVAVRAEFQTLPEATVRIRLFDVSNNLVASTLGGPNPTMGACEFPGRPARRTNIGTTSKQPVAYVILDLASYTGDPVFVIDNLEFSTNYH
jgi:hypothetical protein